MLLVHSEVNSSLDNSPGLRPRAHRLLHPEHPAGVVLPGQPDPRHRRHGLRRAPNRGPEGAPEGGGSNAKLQRTPLNGSMLINGNGHIS